MLLSSLIKMYKMCQAVAAVALRGWRALGVHVVYMYVYFQVLVWPQANAEHL